VPAVHSGPAAGLLGQVLLLAVLAATVGLTSAGWVVGLACGAVVAGLLGRAMDGAGTERLGPADLVTLARVTIAGGVAALTAVSLADPVPPVLVPTVVGMSTVALLLDAVDGRVARRTGTTSALGARFDGESDAFLLLVLSVYVAPSTGAWVLAIGLMRYAFLAAGWVLPWMRGTLPPRYWRKVVTAVQGVALVVAASGLLPPAVAGIGLLAALALLLESFGRDVLWLFHRRGDVRVPGSVPRGSVRPPRSRVVAGWVLTALALALVWVSLLAPHEPGGMSAAAFLRIPLEALVLVGVVLVLPHRAGRVVAAVVGVLLGLLLVVKVLDVGFTVAIGRPFDPATDWGYAGSAVDLLADSLGRTRAVAVAAGAAALAVAVVVLTPLAVLRLARIASRHRATSLRSVGALGVVWVVCAALGLQAAPGAPIASAGAAGLAVDEVGQVYTGLKDQQAFLASLAADDARDTPGSALLTGLRGKDVLVVFVESYGRVAIQDSSFSAPTAALLDDGTRRLSAAGFEARSGFLTSPTYGGISWLAHSTLESGVWVDTQQRYDHLLTTDRVTLSSAFERAGWRTVLEVPPDDRDFPQATTFYHYDQVYDSRTMGYRGPKFSYATVPDQFTFDHLRRAELASTDRTPVFAEVDLVSSHTPWTPLPRMVPWDALGDGSVYDGMPEQGHAPSVVWRDPAQVQAAYAASIRYSLTALISWVETYGDDDLVVVVLGDHQPFSIVSGEGSGRDVPISVIARDPAVLDRISAWGWQPGLRPGPDAPVWPMDAFRDRFLAAYGPQPQPDVSTTGTATGGG
jgi:phosphatidylglycerophosphate synthase